MTKRSELSKEKNDEYNKNRREARAAKKKKEAEEEAEKKEIQREKHRIWKRNQRARQKMNNNNNDGPPGTPSGARSTRPMTQASPIDKIIRVMPHVEGKMSTQNLRELFAAEAAFHDAEARFHGSQGDLFKGDNLKLIKDMETEQLQAVKAVYNNGDDNNDGDKKPAAKKSPIYSDEMGDKKPAAKKSLSFSDKMGE